MKRIFCYGGPNLGVTIIPYTGLLKRMSDEEIQELMGVKGLPISKSMIQAMINKMVEFNNTNLNDSSSTS